MKIRSVPIDCDRTVEMVSRRVDCISAGSIDFRKECARFGREPGGRGSVSTKIHDESRKLKAEGTKPDGRYLSRNWQGVAINSAG